MRHRENSNENAKTGELCYFSRFGLDAILTTEQCAEWSKVAQGQLSNLVTGLLLPAIDFNRRLRRFHARSVLLALGAIGNSLSVPDEKHFLDSILTPEEFAVWFQIPVRSVRKLVKARKLHVMAPNQRFWRFHPRSVLHHLGVKAEALPIQLARAA